MKSVSHRKLSIAMDNGEHKIVSNQHTASEYRHQFPFGGTLHRVSEPFQSKRHAQQKQRHPDIAASKVQRLHGLDNAIVKCQTGRNEQGTQQERFRAAKQGLRR